MSDPISIFGIRLLLVLAGNSIGGIVGGLISEMLDLSPIWVFIGGLIGMLIPTIILSHRFYSILSILLIFGGGMFIGAVVAIAGGTLEDVNTMALAYIIFLAIIGFTAVISKRFLG